MTTSSFPRLSPPAGALAGAEREEAGDVPCPLARGQGDAACPRPDQGTDPPVPAAASGEVDRGGRQPVPGRLGRLLPVRQLSGPFREDQELRADAAGAVHQQAPPPLS